MEVTHCLPCLHTSFPSAPNYLHKVQLKWSSREDQEGKSSWGWRLWRAEVLEGGFVLMGRMGCLCPWFVAASHSVLWPLRVPGQQLPVLISATWQPCMVFHKEEENFSAWQNVVALSANTHIWCSHKRARWLRHKYVLHFKYSSKHIVVTSPSFLCLAFLLHVNSSKFDLLMTLFQLVQAPGASTI